MYKKKYHLSAITFCEVTFPNLHITPTPTHTGGESRIGKETSQKVISDQIFPFKRQFQILFDL